MALGELRSGPVLERLGGKVSVGPKARVGSVVDAHLGEALTGWTTCAEVHRLSVRTRLVSA